MGFKEEEERPRPEFAAKAPFLEKNPVTGIKEPHFPDNLRMKRVVVGTGLIFMMVCLYFSKIGILILEKLTYTLYNNAILDTCFLH